jgi:hypothetical protein
VVVLLLMGDSFQQRDDLVSLASSCLLDAILIQYY